jgi:hypothetical protein
MIYTRGGGEGGYHNIGSTEGGGGGASLASLRPPPLPPTLGRGGEGCGMRRREMCERYVVSQLTGGDLAS